MTDVRDNFFDLYGSIRPHQRPEDFKKIRAEVREAIARSVVLEDKDFDKLYGIKRHEP